MAGWNCMLQLQFWARTVWHSQKRQRTVFSRHGLQKAWLQGMHSGWSSTPLQMPQVNSRSARSCWLICDGAQPLRSAALLFTMLIPLLIHSILYTLLHISTCGHALAGIAERVWTGQPEHVLATWYAM